MAKMITDLTGMTIQEIRKTNLKYIDKSVRKEALSRMVSAANKRLKRMEQDPLGKNSPDIARMKGRKFSIKGIDWTNSDKVSAEFDRLRNFLDPTKKSHSLSGWKKTIKQLAANLDMSEDLYEDKEFWKAYRKFQNDRPNFESHKALGLIGQVWENDLDVEDFTEVFNKLEKLDIDEPGNVAIYLMDEMSIPTDSLIDLMKYNDDFTDDLKSGMLFTIINNRQVLEDIRDGIYEKERYKDITGEFEDYI